MEDFKNILPEGRNQLTNIFTQPMSALSDDDKLSEFTVNSIVSAQNDLSAYPQLSILRSVKSDSGKSSANPFTLKTHSSDQSSKKKEKLTNSNDNSKFSFVSDSLSQKSYASSEEDLEPETSNSVHEKDLKFKKCCVCIII